MSKYGEQIARIDERTGLMLDHLEKLNDSQDKQWKAIKDNLADIRELRTKMSIFAGLQAALSMMLAGIAGWFGSQR